MYLYVKLNWDANCFLPVESKDCMILWLAVLRINVDLAIFRPYLD